MKRIALFFDGTWSKADQSNQTNVTKLHQATIEGDVNSVEQIPWYDSGVGEEGNPLEKVLGGFSGAGMEENIAQGYKKIIEHHEEGDQIFLFGYSRGAYTARSLAGLIRNCGLLHLDHINKIPEARKLYRKRDPGADTDEAKKFRNDYSKIVDIHFIGVWDTVGSRGLPLHFIGGLYNRKYRFHDMRLSGSVKHAYHAIAVDEKCKLFKPSVWTNDHPDVQQVWFSGVHGNVGGGGSDPSISDLALNWISENAHNNGLEFKPEDLPPAPTGYLEASLSTPRKGIYKIWRPHHRKLGDSNINTEALHRSGKERFDDSGQDYNPDNVATYLDNPNHKVTPE